MATQHRTPKGVTKRAAAKKPDRSKIAAKGWATRRARADEAIAAQAIIDERNRREAARVTEKPAEEIRPAKSREALMAEARDAGFAHPLNSWVRAGAVATRGIIRARQDHAENGIQYLVRIRFPDGQLLDEWLPADEVMALADGGQDPRPAQALGF